MLNFVAIRKGINTTPGTSVSQTRAIVDKSSEPIIKVASYSGVPNKSAAHLLIQDHFSFQLTLIRSKTFIKSYKISCQYVYLDQKVKNL